MKTKKRNEKYVKNGKQRMKRQKIGEKTRRRNEVNGDKEN